jgi:hypothetical protein
VRLLAGLLRVALLVPPLAGDAQASRDLGACPELRGHGRIGLVRSRDLVHWRLPGDQRD